jgi:hypothetical protein
LRAKVVPKEPEDESLVFEPLRKLDLMEELLLLLKLPSEWDFPMEAGVQ